MFPKSRRRLALLLSVCGWVSSCSTSPPSGPEGDLGIRIKTVRVAGVPFHPQEGRQCGPAALAMVLAWSGEDVDPEALSAEVYSPELGGSLQASLVAGARRYGRVAVSLYGAADLTRELDAGNPVIVLQNLGLSWVAVWHYAVVIGYDRAADTVTLHTGTSDARQIPESVFEKTWARSGHWGLLVLPPGRVPATADETTYVRAVAGLEQAGQHEAAAAAYGGALAHWPNSLGALVGLGNTYYASGDLSGAESALREAIRHHPDSGVAHNNLAQVLADQGRHRQAIASARRAIEAGGPYTDLFNETLAGILAACRPAGCGDPHVRSYGAAEPLP